MAQSENNSATADNVTDLATARRAKVAKQSVKISKPPSNRRFNKEKVERLKAAIADGSYQINPSRIADKFIEHERN